jgi:hypothetical protein
MEKMTVFLVHSYITIYMAKYYIQRNNIKEANTIILYDRVRIHELEGVPGKKLKFTDTFGVRFTNRNNFWQTYKDVKKFFRNEVNSNFDLVVINLSYCPTQLLASHKKCKKIVYLEEGEQSYNTAQELKNSYIGSFNLYSRAIRKLYSFGKLYMKFPFPDTGKPEEAICVHEDAFKFRNIKKTIVDIRDVFRNKDYKFSEDYTNGVLFLVEHFFRFTPEEQAVLYARLEKVFQYIKSDLGSKVFMKPHPALKDQEIIGRVIRMATEAGLETKIIKDPVELILLNFEKVKLFSNHSSLLRYCCYANIKPYVWGFEYDKEKKRLADGQLERFVFLRSNQEKVEFL